MWLYNKLCIIRLSILHICKGEPQWYHHTNTLLLLYHLQKVRCNFGCSKTTRKTKALTYVDCDLGGSNEDSTPPKCKRTTQ